MRNLKNAIFMSPNFPELYWQFCRELHNNGVRVLGIGDCPYDNLRKELRDSLTEYYKVSNLANYEEVFRAVAFFTFRYGKIDVLESNNEFWLEQDARLRTEFNIPGLKSSDMEAIKRKSAMKAYYAKAGIPTARYTLVTGREEAFRFAHEVGYPVVVKPDNGVGASRTYRLSSDEELTFFLDTKDDTLYIMEEMVHGYVRTYDAIIDGNGKPVFETGNISPGSLMDTVNNSGECRFFIVPQLPEKLVEYGRKTVEVFGIQNRFVHLEYFVLTQDQKGLGKEGDLIGLEVNMRPAGGYCPDMYNFAFETNIYKIWADLVAFGHNTLDTNRPRHYCAYAGRRDNVAYRMSVQEVMDRYGKGMMLTGRVPEALSGAMANQMYICNFETEEEVWDYYQAVLEKA